MDFLSHRPGPPLDAAVASIWYCRSAPRPFGLERVLPSGAAQIIVNLKEDRTRGYDAFGRCHSAPGAVLSGPATTFQIIDTDEQEHVVGVTFRPGGTLSCFRESAAALRGTDVPIEALWGVPGAALLREALLAAATPGAAIAVMEAALRHEWHGRAVHPAVAVALDVFARRPADARVRAIADAVGMSAKRFIERFTHDVGLTPKQFCRVLRFQAAVGQAHAARDVDWAGVALDAGYCDQAHFIHDFRAFSGLTPTGYRAGRTQFQNHVTFLQSPGA